MRLRIWAVVAAFCVLLVGSGNASAEDPPATITGDPPATVAEESPATAIQEPVPVNPNATPEAKKLLAFLYQIQGNHTLAAQHNYCSVGSAYTDQTKQMIGETPIIWGSDFSFAYEGNQPQRFQHCGPINLTPMGTRGSSVYTDLTPEVARDGIVQTAIRLHKEGQIITLMWHAAPPGSTDYVDGDLIWAMERRPTPEQWAEIVTEGTEKNAAWKKQADVIAGYLKQLCDAKVPVLWRPYHEMNGVWFWWCNQKGEDGFKKLWIMMYNHFVKVHELNNLLWVWDANSPRNNPGDEAFAYELFWPGLEYVDVLAADVYGNDWKQSHHDELVKLGQGKPLALGEVGSLPTSQILEAQPRWTWFMPWFAQRNAAAMRTLYADKRILSLEDVTRDDEGNYRIKTSD